MRAHAYLQSDVADPEVSRFSCCVDYALWLWLAVFSWLLLSKVNRRVEEVRDTRDVMVPQTGKSREHRRVHTLLSALCWTWLSSRDSPILGLPLCIH